MGASFFASKPMATIAAGTISPMAVSNVFTLLSITVGSKSATFFPESNSSRIASQNSGLNFEAHIA